LRKLREIKKIVKHRIKKGVQNGGVIVQKKRKKKRKEGKTKNQKNTVLIKWMARRAPSILPICTQGEFQPEKARFAGWSAY